MPVNSKRMRMRGYVRAGCTFPEFSAEVRADLVHHGIAAGLADRVMRDNGKALRDGYRMGVPAECFGPGLFVQAAQLLDAGDPEAVFLSAVAGGPVH